MKKTCNNCNQEVLEGSTFCPNCGTNLNNQVQNNVNQQNNSQQNVNNVPPVQTNDNMQNQYNQQQNMNQNFNQQMPNQQMPNQQMPNQQMPNQQMPNQPMSNNFQPNMNQGYHQQNPMPGRKNTNLIIIIGGVGLLLIVGIILAFTVFSGGSPKSIATKACNLTFIEDNYAEYRNLFPKEEHDNLSKSEYDRARTEISGAYRNTKCVMGDVENGNSADLNSINNKYKAKISAVKKVPMELKTDSKTIIEANLYVGKIGLKWYVVDMKITSIPIFDY